MAENNISVSVSADVADLRTKMALAKNELQSVSAEFNKTAKAVSSASAEMKDAMLPTFQAQSLAVGEAQAKLAGLTSEMKKIAPAATGSHASLSQMLLDFREIFDEASSGRTRMLPGTLARLAQSGFGLSAGMLAGAAGVAALVGGLGYLAYEAIKGADEVKALGEQAAILGRSAEISTTFIDGQMSTMTAMPCVTKKMAQEIIALEIAQTNLSASTVAATNPILKAYAAAYGDSATEKFGKFLESLNKLTPATLKATAEGMNLTSAQYELVDSLLESGRAGSQAAAQTALIGIAAQNAGVSSGTLDQSIASVTAKIAAEKTKIDELKYSTHDWGAATYETWFNLAGLEKQLASLLAAKNALGPSTDHSDDQQYIADLEAAKEMNVKLDERGDILARIKSLTNDISEAQAKGDSGGAATFLAAKQAEQDKLAAMDKDTAAKALEAKVNELDDEQAAVEGQYAKEIAIGAKKLALIKSTLGESSNEYRQAYREQASLVAESSRQEADAAKESAKEQTEANKQALAETLQAIKDAQKTKAEIALNDSETDRKIILVGLKAKEDELDQEVDAGRITNAKKIELLREYTLQEQALAMQSLQAQLAVEDQGTVEYAKTLDDMRLLKAQNVADIAKLDLQGAQAQKQDLAQLTKTYDAAFQPITRAFSSTIEGMIEGTQSLRQAVAKIGQSMVASFIDTGVKALAHWVATELAKTAATQAGNTARMASNTAAAAQGKAADAAVGSASVMGDAHKAAAGAYAAVAGIPIVGPVLAPVAAGAAFAGVMAFDVFSASGGFDIPAGMNPLTQLHENEMVLPATHAETIRSLAGAAAGGGDTHNHTHNWDIDGAQSPRDTAEAVMKKFGQAVRSGRHLTDPNMRKIVLQGG